MATIIKEGEFKRNEIEQRPLVRYMIIRAKASLSIPIVDSVGYITSFPIEEGTVIHVDNLFFSRTMQWIVPWWSPDVTLPSGASVNEVWIRANTEPIVWWERNDNTPIVYRWA